MGKFSPRFNRELDNLIKNRSLQQMPDPRIDSSVLTPQEQTEFLYIEKILLSTLENTINYIKLFQPIEYSFDNIFRTRLSDLCVEINYPIESLDLMVKVPSKSEVGSILRISHNILIDLEDLLKNEQLLTSDLKKKYQKEIKILSKR